MATERPYEPPSLLAAVLWAQLPCGHRSGTDCRTRSIGLLLGRDDAWRALTVRCDPIPISGQGVGWLGPLFRGERVPSPFITLTSGRIKDGKVQDFERSNRAIAELVKAEGAKSHRLPCLPRRRWGTIGGNAVPPRCCLNDVPPSGCQGGNIRRRWLIGDRRVQGVGVVQRDDRGDDGLDGRHRDEGRALAWSRCRVYPILD